MNKVIYFDMDGTIADLYNIKDWLKKLRAEDATPYKNAMPLVNMSELTEVCEALQQLGWKIGIITWLSKDSSRAYKKAVRKAKKDWLERHFPIKFDELHFVQYGTPKHLICKLKRGVLFDDNDNVLLKWQKYGGIAIDAKGDLIHELNKIYAEEVGS